MAWEKGASAGPPVFVASTQDLRRDIGLHQKASNSQLRASMERLHQQDVIFPLIRDETSGNAMVGRLIEDFSIEGGRSFLRWSLPAELVPQMVRHQWGYLDIRSEERRVGKECVGTCSSG